MISITDLKRNDTETAIKLALERRAAGTLTPEIAQQLIMLQDDADAFLEAVDKAFKENETAK